MNSKLQKVTVVLVGCGSISEGWLDGAGDISNLEIIGLVDLREKIHLRRASEYGFGAIESAKRANLCRVLRAIYHKYI